METVAAVASIAGILSLLGEGVAGIRKVSGFYSDIAAGSKTIEKLIHEINGLLKILSDIQNLVEKMPPDFDNLQLASLKIQLSDCVKDIGQWINVSSESRLASESGTKAYLKKIKIAMHKKKIEGMRTEIDRNKQALGVSLTVLGRCLDIRTAQGLHRVNARVEDFHTDFTVGHQAQEASLYRIEEYGISNTALSAGSACSLASIASSLSRLESNVASTMGRSDTGISYPPDPDEVPLVSPTPSTEYPSHNALFVDGWSKMHSRLGPDCPLGNILEESTNVSADSRLVYNRHYLAGPRDDGLYHCPFAGCVHEPNKLKCNHDKHLDSHLKPYRCQIDTCTKEFGSMAARLRHERVVHPGHDDKPFYCTFPECERSTAGRGFPRRWNLKDHLKRVHSYVDQVSSTINSPERPPKRPKTTVTDSRISSGVYNNLAASALEPGLESLGRVFEPTPCPVIYHNHQTLEDITERLYPPILLQYIKSIHELRRREISCRALNLLSNEMFYVKKTKEDNQVPNTDYDTILDLRQQLFKEINTLTTQIQQLRSKCIQAGHSTHQIDSTLMDRALKETSGEHCGQLMRNPNHQDMLTIRKYTQDSGLLGGWSDTRDRVNRWLLHSLRAYDRLAHLHRSMLADPDINDEGWARVVLKYWNLDEAATGVELVTSLSVGAVDSRDHSDLYRKDFVSYVEEVEVEGARDSNEDGIEDEAPRTISSA